MLLTTGLSLCFMSKAEREISDGGGESRVRESLSELEFSVEPSDPRLSCFSVFASPRLLPSSPSASLSTEEPKRLLEGGEPTSIPESFKPRLLTSSPLIIGETMFTLPGFCSRTKGRTEMMGVCFLSTPSRGAGELRGSFKLGA